MRTRKLSLKHSAIAFVLNTEMGYSQKGIATLMGISQSTVSNMIREFSYKQQINSLEQELLEARQIIYQNNILPQNEDYFVNIQ